MKAEHGKLKVDTRYTVESIESMPWVCDNCGMELMNVVTVKDSTGVSYRIGTECAEAVLAFDSSEKWKYEQKLKDYRKLAKDIYSFRKFIQKGGTLDKGAMMLDGKYAGRYRIEFYEAHKAEIDKPLPIRKESKRRHAILEACIMDLETGKPVYDGDGYNCSRSESWTKKLKKALEQNNRTGKYKIIIKYDQPWGDNAPVIAPKMVEFCVA